MMGLSSLRARRAMAAQQAPAPPMTTLTPDVTPYLGQLIGFRRDLHAHPELKYEEQRTAARVASYLEALGRRWGCAPTWTRCRCRRSTLLATPASMRAACTPAATTATPPCCWGRPPCWPNGPTLTAPCTSSSSPAKKAALAPGP